MIKIEIKKLNNVVSEIKVTGHAEFSEDGNDIVCAAISTLIYSVSEELKNDIVSKIDEQQPLFLIKVKNDNEKVRQFMNFLVKSYKDIQKDYKKNILIEEKNDKI